MEQVGVGDGAVVVSHDRAVALIDELRRQEQLLGAAQARRAALMVEFGAVRRGLDQRVIGDSAAEGGRPRYRAGEFTVTEISLAVTASKYGVSRVLGMARRLQAEAPDVWDSWFAGEIDHDKALRINRALRRLVRDDSKQLLNNLVVKVAPLKTPELLGRWLNQFIAQVEPDETDERLRRAFEDRYVSVRPDIDGISFLHAALSCVDAAAIDQLLSALAGMARPGDDRTFAQRRADALVDVLCGRVSNGCHSYGTNTGFDVNTDSDDHLDDPAEPVDEVIQINDLDDESAGPDTDGDQEGASAPGLGDGQVDGRRPGAFNEADQTDDDELSGGGADTASHGPADGGNDNGDGGDSARDDRVDRQSSWDEDDFDRPAGAFRPAGPSSSGRAVGGHQPDDANASGEFAPDPDSAHGEPDGEPVDDGPLRVTDQDGRGVPSSGGKPAVGPGTRPACTCRHQPLPVTIGIVVTASALFGYGSTPGQLADRSSLIPVNIIRDLAAQPGTLFHRLITDDAGNLLEVTELGRFPSRKLGLAVRYRDPVCVTPTCHTPAARCDIDHLTPVPEGPTAGDNLRPECRGEHRAKTHGGHRITPAGEHGIAWTTPTGHTYTSEDPPLPVDDSWPTATPVEASGSSAAGNAATAEERPPKRKATRRRKRRRK